MCAQMLSPNSIEDKKKVFTEIWKGTVPKLNWKQKKRSSLQFGTVFGRLRFVGADSYFFGLIVQKFLLNGERWNIDVRGGAKSRWGDSNFRWGDTSHLRFKYCLGQHFQRKPGAATYAATPLHLPEHKTSGRQ